MILRSLLLHSLPLNRCHPIIFSWFSLQIHIPMMRLSGIPCQNLSCRRSTTPSFENHTWVLVPLSIGRKLVICIWVYRNKIIVDGHVSRYKAMIVSKGFQQVHDIDYDETLSPVVNMVPYIWHFPLWHTRDGKSIIWT
jgi:hypothetical protein